MSDACLAQKQAKSLMEQAVTKLEPNRGGAPSAQESMIIEDVHGSVTVRAGGIIWEHPHAQTVSEEEAYYIEGYLVK